MNGLANGKVFYNTSPLNTIEAQQAKAEPIIAGIPVVDSTMTVTKQITLSGLVPNTKYYYAVEAIDASDNASVKYNLTFTTTP